MVYADRANVLLMHVVDGTQKLYSITGSREGRQKAQANGPPTQEWKLRIACMPWVCLVCQGLFTTECPFIDIRNERVVWASDESTKEAQQRQKAKADKALFEKAFCIMELNEGEKVTVERLRVALRAQNLSSNGHKRDLASRLIEHHHQQQPTQGLVESLVQVVGVPPPPLLASDTISDEEEDSDDEELQNLLNMLKLEEQ